MSFAEELICEMAKENTSILKIDYVDNIPLEISLKSPGDDQWRPMNLDLKPVLGGPAEDVELLSVTPFEILDLDWDKLPHCYVEIGTQWFFTFNHEKQNYSVQLMPYLQKKTKSCVPPKFRPQGHSLNCHWTE